jgi:hypothetical protein
MLMRLNIRIGNVSAFLRQVEFGIWNLVPAFTHGKKEHEERNILFWAI